MLNHFHPKSILFYATTLTSVILLFQATRSYGERQLQAPANVNGRYLSANALPGCPAAHRLRLVIQQSGIYLNGLLESVEPSSDAFTTMPGAIAHHHQEPLSLTGRWQQGAIQLAGTTAALSHCQSLSSQATVTLEGQIVPGSPPYFQGQLRVASQATPLPIRALKEATPLADGEH